MDDGEDYSTPEELRWINGVRLDWSARYQIIEGRPRFPGCTRQITYPAPLVTDDADMPGAVHELGASVFDSGLGRIAVIFKNNGW